MRRCKNCNINVGGEIQQCPICQNALTGEATRNNWPAMKRLRWQSFLYKLQLFIVLALAVISLSLDVLMDLNSGRHWSLPIAIWSISIEFLIRHFIKKSVSAAAIVTESVLHGCALLLFTGWYMGFYRPIALYVVPICLCALVITNLILALTDKKGNAMIYLLVIILMGIIPYIILYVKKIDIPVSYTICLMISVVTFIGICIFKGRAVRNELEKRMNI